MNSLQIVIAGFGGQGILFAGKFLAYKGLLEDRQVSWLPSYGPEMRGGTANCSVILSDSPVGSPIISHPEVLMVMNLPSLDKFEDAVAPGGKIFVDSTLIARQVKRTDVTVHYVPATKMANDAGIPTLANMILLGSLLENTPELSFEGTDAVINKLVPPSKAALVELNAKALQMGKEYK
ncbi:MAG: 2-oxoacid:acceptor oxidoreductase family protein [Oscillospiraceae bacterium]|nr:2-oxoacid:acceptor oxidoreductase family protein [Oscillospiraceae bacterium]